jgi:hypothetical protein
MKKKKGPGRPKLYGEVRAAARLTKEQVRELRLVRATLGRATTDSDAIRWLLDQSARGRHGNYESCGHISGSDSCKKCGP